MLRHRQRPDVEDQQHSQHLLHVNLVLEINIAFCIQYKPCLLNHFSKRLWEKIGYAISRWVRQYETEPGSLGSLYLECAEIYHTRRTKKQTKTHIRLVSLI